MRSRSILTDKAQSARETWKGDGESKKGLTRRMMGSTKPRSRMAEGMKSAWLRGPKKSAAERVLVACWERVDQNKFKEVPRPR